MNKISVKDITIVGMFVAIMLLFSVTPLGMIRLPVANATILHIPVIIGAIVLGPRYGAFLGFVFGLISLYINSTTPTSLLAFAFSPIPTVPGTGAGSWWSLVICFLPRILIGVLPWYCYVGLDKCWKGKERLMNYAICGIVGALTNTILVMHLIFFLFNDAYAHMQLVNEGLSSTFYGFVQGVIIANGIPEAIAAAVITAAICGALTRLNLGQNKF